MATSGYGDVCCRTYLGGDSIGAPRHYRVSPTNLLPRLRWIFLAGRGLRLRRRDIYPPMGDYMHPRSDCAVVACLAILLSACAAREALTRYPRAEIDQPYTLPQGVNTWVGAVVAELSACSRLGR